MEKETDERIPAAKAGPDIDVRAYFAKAVMLYRKGRYRLWYDGKAFVVTIRKYAGNGAFGDVPWMRFEAGEDMAEERAMAEAMSAIDELFDGEKKALAKMIAALTEDEVEDA